MCAQQFDYFPRLLPSYLAPNYPQKTKNLSCFEFSRPRRRRLGRLPSRSFPLSRAAPASVCGGCCGAAIACADDLVACGGRKGLKMVGSFITRGLILILGYAYPAYDCYKTVELNKPEVEQLRFWCQYWILLAVLTVFERVGDNFVSWLPMYSEAKLAFIVYLWYPKTQGTAYVYESFFKPYIGKHETEIDRNLLELRTRASDMAVHYFQKVANYSQTRFYEILQYIASQSQTRPQAQQQQPRTRLVNPAPPHVPSPSAPPQPAQVAPPPPPRNQTQEKTQAPVPVARPGAMSPAQPQPPPGPEAVAANVVQNTEATQVNPSVPSTSQIPDEETLIQEAIRMTRGRLRRHVAGSGPPPK